MSGLKITFPTQELSAAVTAVDVAILAGRRDLLEVLGVQLLSFSQEAYTEKSRGLLGDDGIQWAPLMVSTIMGRLRRAGHLQSRNLSEVKLPEGFKVGKKQRKILQVSQRASKAALNQDLFDNLASAGVKFHDHKTGKLLRAGKRAKSQAFVTNYRGAVGETRIDVNGYEIGVDTGLQRAAATPAYKSNPNQIFEIVENSVTVGYGRNYSKFFDLRRKLFPDELPEAWLNDLEEIASDYMQRVAEEAINKKDL